MALPISSVPVFPNEIFSHILANFRSESAITHLWTDCRNVSRTWRDIVESIFISRYVKQLRPALLFDNPGCLPGYDVYDEMKHYYTCSFERFSDESKRTAVFRMHRMIKTAKSCCPKFSAVESCLAKRPTCYYPRPPQVVYFRRLANDTEIPGLKIKDNHPTEMECDWRGTFTALLWESKLVDPDHFKVKSQDFNIRAWICDPRLSTKVSKERMKPHLDRMASFMDAAEDELEKRYVYQRRKRIARQCKAHGIEWVPDEKEQKKTSRVLREARDTAMEEDDGISVWDDEDFRLNLTDAQLNGIDVTDLLSEDEGEWEDASDLNNSDMDTSMDSDLSNDEWESEDEEEDDEEDDDEDDEEDEEEDEDEMEDQSEEDDHTPVVDSKPNGTEPKRPKMLFWVE